MRPGLATLLPLVLAATAFAAPLQRNLGDGLVYFRVRSLPGDLPGDPALAKHPAIVDVRFAKSDAGAATVFDSWLKFHASPRQPFFVLANAATAPALLATLSGSGESGVITLGIPGERFTPAVPVESTATEEKRAYQALDDGATVASLVTDHPDKQRNDEASLTQPPAETLAAAGASANPAPATPPTDASLQRAIQLFRGLKALKSF